MGTTEPLRAQHIAEAGGGENSAFIFAGIISGSHQGVSPISFDVPITLVGLTALSELVKMKSLYPAAFCAAIHQVLQAKNIGLHGLGGGFFTDTHMLECGGMKDNINVTVQTSRSPR